MTSSKLVRKGKCNKCGNCCRNIILSTAEKIPIRTPQQFEDTKKYDNFFENFYISGKDEKSGVLLFTCCQIDNNNRCRLYWLRGIGCRLYPQPNTKYLINGGKMLDGCGFYFEPNKTFKSYLERK